MTSPAEPFTSRLIEHCGAADRPTIVFLHGVYHGSWAFEQFWPPFQQSGFSVGLLDLRGHWGEHRLQPNSPVGFAEFLKDANQALDRLPGEKVLVGHSLGGLLALKLAARTDLVAMVLMATPLPSAIRRKQWRLLLEFPFQTTRFLLTGNAAALYHAERFTARYLFSRRTSAETKALAQARIRQQHEPARLFREIMSLDFSPSERRIPTLLVLGEEDPTVTSEVGFALQRLTQGEVVTIPQAGHDIMLEPNAAQASQIVLDWTKATCT